MAERDSVNSESSGFSAELSVSDDVKVDLNSVKLVQLGDGQLMIAVSTEDITRIERIVGSVEQFGIGTHIDNSTGTPVESQSLRRRGNEAVAQNEVEDQNTQHLEPQVMRDSTLRRRIRRPINALVRTIAWSVRAVQWIFKNLLRGFRNYFISLLELSRLTFILTIIYYTMLVELVSIFPEGLTQEVLKILLVTVTAYHIGAIGLIIGMLPQRMQLGPLGRMRPVQTVVQFNGKLGEMFERFVTYLADRCLGIRKTANGEIISIVPGSPLKRVGPSLETTALLHLLLTEVVEDVKRLNPVQSSDEKDTAVEAKGLSFRNNPFKSSIPVASVSNETEYKLLIMRTASALEDNLNKFYKYYVSQGNSWRWSLLKLRFYSELRFIAISILSYCIPYHFVHAVQAEIDLKERFLADLAVQGFELLTQPLDELTGLLDSVTGGQPASSNVPGDMPFDIDQVFALANRRASKDVYGYYSTRVDKRKVEDRLHALCSVCFKADLYTEDSSLDMKKLAP